MTTTELFAYNLRNVLYAKGKTQAELAKGVKTSPTSVSQWVNAVVMPRPYMIDRICAYLNCSFEDLTTDHTQTAEPTPEDVLAEELRDNPRLFKLMFYASKLSDRELDQLIERAKKK